MIFKFKPIGNYFNLLLIINVIIISVDKFNCIENVNVENSSKVSLETNLNLDNKKDSSILDNNDNKINSLPPIIEVENDDENEDDSNKFSWKDHNDDHGIYSQRSLMSTSGIKRLISNEEELENSGIAEDDLSALKRVDYSEKEWQLMFRSFDMTYDGLASSILLDTGKKLNFYDEILSRLKPECRRDLQHVGNSVKKHKLWALRMLDSNGKIPSGITYGRFSSPGDYEECLSVNVDEDVYKSDINNKKYNKYQQKLTKTKAIEHYKFKGKYCLIDFRLPVPEKPKNKLMSIHDPILDLSKTELGKSFPGIKNFTGYASVFHEVGYLHGFCIPSTCDILDLTNSIGKTLEGLYVIVNNTIDCEVKLDERPPLRTSQLISIALLTIVFLNAAIASIVHYYLENQKNSGIIKNRKELQEDNNENNQNKEDEEAEEVYRVTTLYSKLKIWFKRTILGNKFYSDCFSIQSNFYRLTKPDPRGLTFVHYTRIVAMALTVITHTGAMGTLQAITKPADASNSEQIFRDLIPQMLANAFTSIQIFFFMAGFMLVVSTYPSIKREKGYLSFIEYATKRAVRLMPGLAATIAINFLWPLFVDGPMLSYFFRIIVIPCEEKWYRTLGFLSNFDHVEKMCIRHSYFSASDYQLHLVAFPLLILLYKKPAISLIIASILTIAGFAVQVIMILTKTLVPFMMVDYVDKEMFFNVVHYIHHPVWNHMSAFFYGFIVGYLVAKQIRFNISEKTIKRIWFTLMPIGVASIFAPYFWNHYKRPIYKWQMVLYVLFDRFALLSACAWLSYATMVLARPVKKKSDKQEKNINLPEVLTIDDKKNNFSQKQQQFVTPTQTNVVRTPNLTVTSEQEINGANENNSKLSVSGKNLQPVTINNSIPRQRSFPNIREASFIGQTNHQQQQHHSLQFQPLKTSYSNVNLSTIQETSSDENKPDSMIIVNDKGKQLDNKRTINNNNANDTDKKEEAKTEENKRRAPVVSNINTLCLVLSRLTFQLYLFNMVVLWIDVNHSKYIWFFSYYFIITKALAVYICAGIMATIFFVTLESPCLTLYIMWIKSRAKARGRRQQSRGDQIIKQQQQQTDSNNKKDFADDRKSSPELMNKFPKSSSQASGSVKNFDGINMRACTPSEDLNGGLDKSSITFIDLPANDGKSIMMTSADNQKQDGSQTKNNTKL